MNYNNTTNVTCVSLYDGKEYIGVTIASVISGFISFLASTFVIALIMFFQKWRFLVQRLILYLAVTTLLQGIAAMLHRVDYVENDPDKMRFCVFAGFFEQQAAWMQLNAVTCITAHLFLCAVVRVTLEKLEPLYVFTIFLLPFLFNWIPFIDLAYGKAGAWCWIRDNTNCTPFEFGIALRFVLWYVPLYLILITLVILYVIILIKVHRNRKRWVGSYDPNSDRVRGQIQEEVIPLIWYPLIYLILNVIAFINRIQNLANRDQPNLGLWYLHALTYPLTGGLIALPFTLDPSTRRRLHWASIKLAAKELCYGEDMDIVEYPIETENTDILAASDESSESFNNTKEKVSYKSFKEK